MIVLGAGYIAAELSGMSQQFGSHVSWAYRKERPLRAFDHMLTDNLVEIYREAGMDLYSGYVAERIEERDGQYTVFFENGQTLTGTVYCLLGDECPIPNTLVLENTDVSLDEKGFVIVDKYQNTTAESIFCSWRCDRQIRVDASSDCSGSSLV